MALVQTRLKKSQIIPCSLGSLSPSQDVFLNFVANCPPFITAKVVIFLLSPLMLWCTDSMQSPFDGGCRWDRSRLTGAPLWLD